MKLKTDEFNDLAICAFRYALGRRTYITAVVSDLLIKYYKELTESSKLTIAKDIYRAFETNNYGMEMDKEEWEKLLKIIQDGI